EEGGGEAPLGFYLSLSGRGRSAVELDLAYHHDTGQLTEGPDIFDTKLDTFTALAGPRIGPAPRYGQTGGARPYFHILGGGRRGWLACVGRAGPGAKRRGGGARARERHVLGRHDRPRYRHPARARVRAAPRRGLPDVLGQRREP